MDTYAPFDFEIYVLNYIAAGCKCQELFLIQGFPGRKNPIEI